MVGLNTEPNIRRPDDIYELLIELQEGCSVDETLKRYAKLILSLANHIGDEQVIAEAITVARGTGAVQNAAID